MQLPIQITPSNENIEKKNTYRIMHVKEEKTYP